MKALKYKFYWVIISSFSMLFFGINTNSFAQTNTKQTRKAVITTSKIDKDGKKIVEKIERTGAEASQEAIDELIKKAVSEGKSINVEVEDREEATKVEVDEDKAKDNKDKNIVIFQGEDGKKTVIRKEIQEEVQWTQRENIEEKLQKLGIVLPTPTPPAANYVNAVTSDKTVYMAGKGPSKSDGTYITGKVGKDLSIEEGYQAARLVGINQLAALKAQIGDLNRVKRIVKVLGMVNATADFTNHPEVINGFSDLMVEVFGERGKHARSAVGMYSLPRNIAVEVEMVVEIE